LTKREFTIIAGDDTLQTLGHLHKNVAVKYLMKRRRSVLMTKDNQKVDKLFADLPRTIIIVGKNITHTYKVNWEREGTTDFEGSRFIFTMNEVSAPEISVPLQQH
jgi:hypothetical protein